MARSMALLAAVGAASATYQLLADARDRRRFRPPGRLIDVGGRRLHLTDEGTGSPAVVIVPALGGDVSDWIRIQRELASDIRVCVYDRAGIAWSDPPPRGRRTLDTMADELQQLLTVGGVSPPYVIAGYSFGGIVARRFATRYPDVVAGMVLIDSSHEDQPRRLDGGKWRRDCVLVALRRRSQILGLRRLAATAGLIRGLDDAAFARAVPPEFIPANRAIALSSRHRRIAVRETLMLARSQGQPPSLGSLPLTVLTADWGDGTWMQLQTELSNLSTDSKHIVASETGHDIPVDAPDLIIEAIRDLVARTAGHAS